MKVSRSHVAVVVRLTAVCGFLAFSTWQPAAAQGVDTHRSHGSAGEDEAAHPGRAARGLELDDVVRMRGVSDLQLSPDGRTVAFTVREMDLEADRWRTSVWSAPLSGDVPARRLTRSAEGERSPRWSPDGRYLAFLSGREGEGSESSQIWLLPAEGGEAFQATAFDRGISSFAWSPDGGRFAVSMSDEPEDPPPLRLNGVEPPEDRPLPHVITRLQFVQDGRGYIGERRSHIYVIGVDPDGKPATEAAQLTSGPYDDSSPQWSPDGRWIAFGSNRTEWPDVTYQTDIWLVSGDGERLVQLLDDPGSDSGPIWSPDGRMIAYRHTPPEPPVYGSARLRTMEIEESGGDPRAGAIVDLTDSIDRPVQGSARWAADGEHVYAVIQDRGTQPLLRIPARGGEVEVLISGTSVVQQFAVTPDDAEVAAILSWETQPSDIFVVSVEPEAVPPDFFASEAPEEMLRGASPVRNLSRINAGWLEEVELSEPVHFRYPSRDGTRIAGWYLLPPGAGEEDGPFPLILKIHGGPVSQYNWAFDFERQWWASQGYAVLYTNPRGSSGYGEGFAYALWRDWGGPDYDDVIGGVDWLVERGIADPDRMGVGGWSYGGILTNFIIVRDHRFRAAISGASTALNVSLYGTDDLQRWWEHELGLPWENREVYDRISSLYEAHRVRTPTLFVVGGADRRTPASQSEQFYTALRRLEIPTGLIVYPGQGHGISRPSFVIDRYERYRRWYDLHVLGREDADPFFGRRSW